jgi:hypothetical protein
LKKYAVVFSAFASPTAEVVDNGRVYSTSLTAGDGLITNANDGGTKDELYYKDEVAVTGTNPTTWGANAFAGMSLLPNSEPAANLGFNGAASGTGSADADGEATNFFLLQLKVTSNTTAGPGSGNDITVTFDYDETA